MGYEKKYKKGCWNVGCFTSHEWVKVSGSKSRGQEFLFAPKH